MEAKRYAEELMEEVKHIRKYKFWICIQDAGKRGSMAENESHKDYAGQYDPAIMSAAKQDISELLNEEIEKNSVLDFIQERKERQEEKLRKQEQARLNR